MLRHKTFVSIGRRDVLARHAKIFRAFRNALVIVRCLWASHGEPYIHDGEILFAYNINFGPIPERRIRVITGVMDLKSLRRAAFA